MHFSLCVVSNQAQKQIVDSDPVWEVLWHKFNLLLKKTWIILVYKMLYFSYTFYEGLSVSSSLQPQERKSSFSNKILKFPFWGLFWLQIQKTAWEDFLELTDFRGAKSQI